MHNQQLVDIALRKIFEDELIVTNWVLVVEGVREATDDNPSGRGLLTISAEQTAPWLQAGMLTSALDDSRAYMQECSESQEEEDE